MNHLSRLKSIAWYNLEKLTKAVVLIIGAGGIGASLAEMLARSAVGNITLVDFDIVQPENYNRNFFASELGIPKVEAVKKRIKSTIPQCDIQAISANVLLPGFQAEFRELIEKSDLVVHVTDCRTARSHVNSVVREEGKTLLDCAGAETQTQFHLHVIRPDGACAECLTLTSALAAPKKENKGDCAASSYMPNIQTAASLLAHSIIGPLLLGHGNVPSYLMVDLSAFTITEFEFTRHPACSVCHPKKAT